MSLSLRTQDTQTELVMSEKFLASCSARHDGAKICPSRRVVERKTNLFQDLQRARGEHDHGPLLHHGVAIPAQADYKVVSRGGVGEGSGGGVDPHVEGRAA